MLKNQPLRMMADDICKLEIQLLIDFQFAIHSDDNLNTVLLEFMIECYSYSRRTRIVIESPRSLEM